MLKRGIAVAFPMSIFEASLGLILVLILTGILDAAERNGYDRELVFNEAVRKVRGRIYIEAFNELNRKAGPREEKLQDILARLQRVGGAYKDLKQSISRRYKGANKRVTPETRKNLMDVWMKQQKRRLQGDEL